MRQTIEWEKVRNIVHQQKKAGVDVLTETDSKQILQLLGLKVPPIHIAREADRAVAAAKEIGFPVVMKIHSHEITHKSDAGGVFVNVKDEQGVREKFETIVTNAQIYQPSIHSLAVSVQPMEKPGTEVIVGMNRDEVFGPTLMFGLGGVWVELLKDVSLRVSPLQETDVEEMIDSIKGRALLGPYRGSAPRDLSSLKEIIFSIEKLAIECPEIREIDLNPAFLYEEGAGHSIVDARILL